MPKKQRVKFHKGDRRPRNDKDYPELKYRKRMIKRDTEILWRVTEYPNKNVIAEYFFEEDAKKLCDFQNKNQVWRFNGGIPKFLSYK
jgi:hypothetical protein